MSTAIDEIYVKSHVARDLLQSAGLFKTDKLVVWEYVSNGLQYANPGTNITKPLIEAYNTASGVAAPAAKPANTPARPSGAAATRPPAA